MHDVDQLAVLRRRRFADDGPVRALSRRTPLSQFRDLALTFVTSLIVLIGVLISPAYPWGSKGHEIVAASAETHLKDTARKRIKELLPQGTTLADASTWPDKAGRQIPDMDPYHFINFPKDANAYDQQRDCKLRNWVIEAIAWWTSIAPCRLSLKIAAATVLM